MQSKLKKMRLSKKIKQKDLAHILKISPSAVNIQELKGIHDTRTAKRYAEALQCDVFFLLDGLD